MGTVTREAPEMNDVIYLRNIRQQWKENDIVKKDTFQRFNLGWLAIRGFELSEFYNERK